MRRPAEPRTPALWWDVLPRGVRLEPAPPLEGATAASTCIVGGGIAGASLALALARRGEDVVLLDRGFPGSGATGRNAGFLLAESDCFGMTVARLGERAARRLRAAGLATREFVRSVGAPVAWTGSVRVASDADEAAWFADSAAAGLDGVRTAPLDDVPETGASHPYVAALLDDGDGMTQPLVVLAAIHAELTRRGARRFDGTAATSIRDTRGGVTVTTTAGRVRVARVVVATNSEARALLGARAAPVRPVRAQALAAFADPMPPWTRPAYGTRGGDYWRPVGRDRVLLGGLRRLDRRAEATRSSSPSPPLQSALSRMLRRLVGRAARLEVTHRWAGTMGFTPDGLPRIGPLAERPRVHLFAGWNGHGMGWAPGFAAAFAASLVDRAPPPLAGLHPIHLGRPRTRP